jgi:predicted nucleic acid-binding Zn ribbon protein
MVEDHKHCIVCGKATAPDKLFCSPSCDELMKAQQKRMKKSRTIMLVLFVVMFVVIIISSALRTSG